MRNSQKGFTLIELLAVIIILAIIALITTPIILNVVEDSRKSAAEDKAYGVVDAVRLAYQQHQMKDSPTTQNPVIVSFDGENRGILGADMGETNQVKVSISGDYPEAGTVSVYQQDVDATTSEDNEAHEIGTIKVEGLKFGNYICNSVSAGSSKIKCERQ